MGQLICIIVCVLGIVLILALLINKLSKQKSSNETEFCFELLKIFKFHMKHKSKK